MGKGTFDLADELALIVVQGNGEVIAGVGPAGVGEQFALNLAHCVDSCHYLLAKVATLVEVNQVVFESTFLGQLSFANFLGYPGHMISNAVKFPTVFFRFLHGV